MQQQSVKLKAELMWPSLNKVNEMSGKYQVDLCNLSEPAVKALEAMGLEVKRKDDKGNFITCKSTRPIYAYDDGGAPIDGGVVGNGSKAACIVSTYDYNFKGKRGKGASLAKLVVTDLKEYVAASAPVALEEDELL